MAGRAGPQGAVQLQIFLFGPAALLEAAPHVGDNALEALSERILFTLRRFPAGYRAGLRVAHLAVRSEQQQVL